MAQQHCKEPESVLTVASSLENTAFTEGWAGSGAWGAYHHHKRQQPVILVRLIRFFSFTQKGQFTKQGNLEIVTEDTGEMK
jgi:hypothetical protein